LPKNHYKSRNNIALLKKHHNKNAMKEGANNKNVIKIS